MCNISHMTRAPSITLFFILFTAQGQFKQYWNDIERWIVIMCVYQYVPYGHFFFDEHSIFIHSFLMLFVFCFHVINPFLRYSFAFHPPVNDGSDSYYFLHRCPLSCELMQMIKWINNNNKKIEKRTDHKIIFLCSYNHNSMPNSVLSMAELLCEHNE